MPPTSIDVGGRVVAIEPEWASPKLLTAHAEDFALLASRYSVRFAVSTPEGHAIEIDGPMP